MELAEKTGIADIKVEIKKKYMDHELRRNIESIARRSLKWTHLGNMKPGRARAHEGGP